MNHYAPKKSLIAAALATALVFSANVAAEGVKIGALLPLTGGLQAYGGGMLNGVKLAVDEANAAGGALGGQVELAVGDTQTKAQPSIDAAKKLTSVEGVAGIVGAASSGNTIPVAQSVTSVDGVAQISPSATAPNITTLKDNDFLFRTAPSDAYQGVALAQVVQERGANKVAVIYVNNDYGDGLAKNFEAAFTGMGGTVTASSAYEPNKASYRGELQQVAKEDPEALLLIAYPDDGGITILKQSLEEGFFNKFIFTDGMRNQKVIDDIGAEYLNGSYGTQPQAVESDASTAFKAAFQTKYGEEVPHAFIDTSYDSAAMLILAAAKAGSDDPKAVRDALRDVANAPGTKIMPGELAKGIKAAAAGEDIDYMGAGGDYEFDDNGDVSGSFEHWEIKDGQITPVTVFVPK